MKSLDSKFWDNKYLNDSTGWDLGCVSPPLKAYIDQLSDKNSSILIPGAGNAYEVDYLLENDFKDVTVIDIAPTLVNRLKTKYQGNKFVHLILGDFFDFNERKFEIIFEQTFFCALNPDLRKDYVVKTHDLLNKDGKLVGVLFNRDFDSNPPFGGDVQEYKLLFEPLFRLKKLEQCKNSFPAREGSELWINFEAHY